jgi:glycosyltransferase involved in cell wall biosynthesis
VRVLTVLDGFRLGGAETVIAQLARFAPTADLELEVLSLQAPSDERSTLAPMLVDAGLRPRYLNATRIADPGAFNRLLRYLRSCKPDVVHAHLEMAMTMALPAARLAGRPAVGTFHHVYRPLSGRAAARERLAVEVATRSEGAIFLSRASLVSFAERYRPGRPLPATWSVIHNGIDLDYFSPARGRRVVSMPADLGLARRRVVTIVAALREFKGIIHMIQAWPTVVSRCPDARLLLVGTGSEEPSLRREAGYRQVTDSVVFAGMRTDIPDVLRGSEIVVLPSIYGENLPTVLMEASGCARAVVASDVGGIRDIVSNEETGLLVPPGGSTALGNAILRLLDDPALSRKFGNAGRLRMQRLFDAHLWAANLRTAYERAIEARHPSWGNAKVAR